MIPTTQIHASNSAVKNHRIINRKSKIDLFVYSEFFVTFLDEVHDLVSSSQSCVNVSLFCLSTHLFRGSEETTFEFAETITIRSDIRV